MVEKGLRAYARTHFLDATQTPVCDVSRISFLLSPHIPVDYIDTKHSLSLTELLNKYRQLIFSLTFLEKVKQPG